MRSPAIRTDEDVRLADVQRYRFDEVAKEPAYDRIVQLATRLFGTPSAFVSLVERDRQVFYAKTGICADTTSRDISFCGHAVFTDSLLIVLDTHDDERFYDNPLVTGDPFIRFYVGMPLRSRSGHVLGTLCLVDVRPWPEFSDTHRRDLDHLARLVEDLFEMRRLDVSRYRHQARFEQVSTTSPDGIICADQRGIITAWNPAAERLFGYTLQEAAGQSIDLITLEAGTCRHAASVQRLVSGGSTYLIGKTVELLGRHKDGTPIPIELSLSMWREEDELAFAAIVRDIRERRENEQRLFRLAHRDGLTGIPNRTALHIRLAEAIAAGPVQVLLLDLDGFKSINDTLGHGVGDEVLCMTAERLLTCVRPGDTVARLGGDEFAIVMSGEADAVVASTAARTIIARLTEPFVIDEQVIALSASVGLAETALGAATADELLSRADMAMYQAKADGHSCARAFTSDLRQKIVRERDALAELHRAVEKGEFVLYYQPQVRLSDASLVGAEALLRWQHPERGLLSPGEFLADLERSRFATTVGTWVLETACQQASRWRRSGYPAFQVGINLFGAQCCAVDLPAQVLSALAQARLPTSALELEITETVVLDGDDGRLQRFEALRVAGVGIALDDYGTGYASLSALKGFPLTRLKIDRSFVQDVCNNSGDAALVRSLLYLGRAFGLQVIAEGVETSPQQAWLGQEGCVEAQGYLFGAPMSPEAFEAQFGFNTISAGAWCTSRNATMRSSHTDAFIGA